MIGNAAQFDIVRPVIRSNAFSTHGAIARSGSDCLEIAAPAHILYVEHIQRTHLLEGRGALAGDRLLEVDLCGGNHDTKYVRMRT
jgi:hypothetical protein